MVIRDDKVVKNSVPNPDPFLNPNPSPVPHPNMNSKSDSDLNLILNLKSEPTRSEDLIHIPKSKPYPWEKAVVFWIARGKPLLLPLLSSPSLLVSLLSPHSHTPWGTVLISLQCELSGNRTKTRTEESIVILIEDKKTNKSLNPSPTILFWPKPVMDLNWSINSMSNCITTAGIRFWLDDLHQKPPPPLPPPLLLPLPPRRGVIRSNKSSDMNLDIHLNRNRNPYLYLYPNLNPDPPDVHNQTLQISSPMSFSKKLIVGVEESKMPRATLMATLMTPLRRPTKGEFKFCRLPDAELQQRKSYGCCYSFREKLSSRGYKCEQKEPKDVLGFQSGKRHVDEDDDIRKILWRAFFGQRGCKVMGCQMVGGRTFIKEPPPSPLPPPLPPPPPQPPPRLKVFDIKSLNQLFHFFPP